MSRPNTSPDSSTRKRDIAVLRCALLNAPTIFGWVSADIPYLKVCPDLPESEWAANP